MQSGAYAGLAILIPLSKSLTKSVFHERPGYGGTPSNYFTNQTFYFTITKHFLNSKQAYEIQNKLVQKY